VETFLEKYKSYVKQKNNMNIPSKVIKTFGVKQKDLQLSLADGSGYIRVITEREEPDFSDELRDEAGTPSE